MLMYWWKAETDRACATCDGVWSLPQAAPTKKYEDGIVISQAALTYVPNVRDMKQTP